MFKMTRTDPEWKDKIITGDETWVYGYDPETKRQSAEWRGQEKNYRFHKNKVYPRLYYNSNIICIHQQVNVIKFRQLYGMCSRNDNKKNEGVLEVLLPVAVVTLAIATVSTLLDEVSNAEAVQYLEAVMKYVQGSLLDMPSSRKQRSTFDQVSEFDRGRIVAYRDCILSFRKIGSRVGRNQTTVMRICDRWMQEGTTDRRVRSHPPQCTTSRADRQIVRMAVTDRSVTSRTVEQHIQSVYSRVVCPQDLYYFAYPSRRTTDVSAANGAMKEGCGRQNGMKLSLLAIHASVCNTTMVGFESGDTVERGC
ncbi:hypothetical protein LAZ67_19001205 [Cordylochernes scorpioides]|uniref:Uncharacterized protein n=1 Tax=Cordylochernes scorpioides TaxID=51811 RepID=A0ABY6LHN1_9ARAC|nr:hypothetical protein LAZ67_19001205 [Cordylochernes scorpioides]